MDRTKRAARALGLALATAALLAGAAVAAEDGPGLTGVVNVNTASVEELQLLPGIGEARAEAVIALRKQRGGFKSVDELRDVKGIGEAGMAKLRPFVSVEGRTTARAE